MCRQNDPKNIVKVTVKHKKMIYGMQETSGIKLKRDVW